MTEGYVFGANTGPVVSRPAVKVSAFASSGRPDDKNFAQDLAPLEFLTLYNGRAGDKGTWRLEKSLSLSIGNEHVATEITGKRYTHLLQAVVRGDSGFRWKIWNSHYWQQRQDAQQILATCLGIPHAGDLELNNSFAKLSSFFGGDNRFLQVITVLLAEGAITPDLAAGLIKAGATGSLNDLPALLAAGGVAGDKLGSVLGVMIRAKYSSKLVKALFRGLQSYSEAREADPEVLPQSLPGLVARANGLVNPNVTFSQAWRCVSVIEESRRLREQRGLADHAGKIEALIAGVLADLPIDTILNMAFVEGTAGLLEDDGTRQLNFGFLSSALDPRLVELKKQLAIRYLRDNNDILGLIQAPQIADGEPGIISRISENEQLQRIWLRCVRAATPHS